MKIERNKNCVQCEKVKEEVVTLNHGEDKSSFCEKCLNNYLDGKIIFIDAHELAD